LPATSTICYIGNIGYVGGIDWAYNEFTSELLAVNEFNKQHKDIKIAPVNGLRV
jgi:hypothetical protein